MAVVLPPSWFSVEGEEAEPGHVGGVYQVKGLANHFK